MFNVSKATFGAPAAEHMWELSFCSTRNASSHTGRAAQVATKPCLAQASPGRFQEAQLLGRESDLLSLQQGTRMSRITGKRKRLVDKASTCVCVCICKYTRTNKPPQVILTGIKVEDDVFTL